MGVIGGGDRRELWGCDRRGVIGGSSGGVIGGGCGGVIGTSGIIWKDSNNILSILLFFSL